MERMYHTPHTLTTIVYCQVNRIITWQIPIGNYKMKNSNAKVRYISTLVTCTTVVFFFFLRNEEVHFVLDQPAYLFSASSLK